MVANLYLSTIRKKNILQQKNRLTQDGENMLGLISQDRNGPVIRKSHSVHHIIT